jgi:hypothetical protein
MSILRFHLDEDCQAAAFGAALREHGIDTTTTNEIGKPGVDDDGQLQHATETGRVIVSNNIGDFSAIHGRWLGAGWPQAAIMPELSCFLNRGMPSARSCVVCYIFAMRYLRKTCGTGWNG